MRTNWKSVGKTKNSRKKSKMINLLLIGTFLLVILLLFCGCSPQIKYVEVEREPITCIDEIKTPLDMAKCLNEYKTRY